MALENHNNQFSFFFPPYIGTKKKKKKIAQALFSSVFLTIPFLTLRGYCLQPRECCWWAHETSANPQNRCNDCDHQGGKWYGCDHGHERAVKWEFLGKGKTYWRSFGFLDCAYKRIILPHFLQVLGLVLYPTPQKSHLSIAFLYRILRSCQGLASVCKSILPFLIFVAWFLFWGFFFFHIY